MDKSLLQQVVLDQRRVFEKKEKLVKRVFSREALVSKKIVVITGVRRSGKSTLLKEIAEHSKEYYYLNFEDERLLNFIHTDFNDLYEVFLQLYGERHVFLLDEIQNIVGWEKFVRRLFEDNNKIYITGSNAKLLSSELATTLTGRHITIELFPFSFKEFLEYKSFSIKKAYDTREKARLLRLFDDYVQFGGFPEMSISQDEREFKQLYQDILIKDLLVRFNIKDTKDFRELALYLISNIGSRISYNNLRKILEFNSVTTVKNYIELLESAYLNFTISKFDFSLRKQITNDKKTYSIDTGIVNNISFAFSKNSGRLLENIVFLENKRRGGEIYYFAGKNECDFILKKGRVIIEAIQVTESISKDNEEREIGGLIEAIESYGLTKGIILTYDQSRHIKRNGLSISIKPVWKWLLEG